MTAAPARIAIYGTGRAGCALAAALRAAGVELTLLWNRGRAGATHATAALALEVTRGTPPPAPAAGTEAVLLCAADSAIAEVCQALAAGGALAGVRLVAHISGALGLEVLHPAAAVGCAVGSIHPLRSLLGHDTPLAGAFCALDGDPRALPMLADLATALGCPSAQVSGPRRALYHAGAAVAANDLAALVSAAIGALEGAGLPAALAQDAALDLARGVLDNIDRRGPVAALTGPVARGDHAVIARHLEALAAHRPELAAAHRALSRIALELARRQGTPEAHLVRMARTLGHEDP